MDKIIDRIYIGDQADGQNIENLKIVQAVVNATPMSDSLNGAAKYIRLDHDDGVPWPFEKLDRYLAFMRGLAHTDKVLVHCAAGASRAPSLVILWMMICGFGWDEAEVLVRSRRSITAPNPALKESILRYLGG